MTAYECVQCRAAYHGDRPCCPRCGSTAYRQTRGVWIPYVVVALLFIAFLACMYRGGVFTIQQLMAALLTLAMVLAGSAIYVLPALIAMRRNHASAVTLTLLNIVAGWTLLGWITALVWAFGGEASPGHGGGPAGAAAFAHEPPLCPHCADALRRAARRCRHGGACLITPER